MTLLGSRRVYTGRVVSLDVDTVRFPNGEVGELEMLRHVGAAAVVPFLDDITDADPRIVLIRQFRHATDGWLWEIPAGLCEKDEPPEATARRELREETGYSCVKLEPITSIWTTPGFTDEVIGLYAAYGLTPGETAHEHDEVMELHQLHWSQVMTMIQDGEIRDGKTLVALLALAARRGGV